MPGTSGKDENVRKNYQEIILFVTLDFMPGLL